MPTGGPPGSTQVDSVDLGRIQPGQIVHLTLSPTVPSGVGDRGEAVNYGLVLDQTSLVYPDKVTLVTLMPEDAEWRPLPQEGKPEVRPVTVSRELSFQQAVTAGDARWRVEAIYL